MADETEHQPHAMLNDPNNVPITFVNELSHCGFLNGVVNLTFGVAKFSPWTTGEPDQIAVKPDVIVASQLRMDLYAAQVLRDELTRILDAQHVRPAPGEKVN
jgi:hypothetical protein